MNRARRKELERAEALVREALEIVQTCRDEEEEYLYNLPENMQSGEKYEKAEGNVSCLDDAISALEEVCDTHIAGAVGE